eukprot:scaffold14788_cov127-Isochrysis_galbana.AAC.5
MDVYAVATPGGSTSRRAACRARARPAELVRKARQSASQAGAGGGTAAHVTEHHAREQCERRCRAVVPNRPSQAPLAAGPGSVAPGRLDGKMTPDVDRALARGCMMDTPCTVCRLWRGLIGTRRCWVGAACHFWGLKVFGMWASASPLSDSLTLLTPPIRLRRALSRVVLLLSLCPCALPEQDARLCRTVCAEMGVRDRGVQGARARLFVTSNDTGE